MNKQLEQAPLGKRSSYKDTYDPSLLFAIARKLKRQEIGIDDKVLPFKGCDLWTGFELSWLNQKGKPQIAVALFSIPCHSTNIIESKSFKLYLNSFNNSKFDSCQQVQALLIQDLSNACGEVVEVSLLESEAMAFNQTISKPDAVCLDELDITCQHYTVSPHLLALQSDQIVHERLYSNLLKSNCLVTGQPDWGSVMIEYQGPQLDNKALLEYIVSFRNHNEFHEQCVERIFQDLMQLSSPNLLTVYARYTRRGGLDINPFRSTKYSKPEAQFRLFRQ